MQVWGRKVGEMQQKTASVIASLTSLTQLTLAEYGYSEGLSALHGLELQELRLKHCSNAAASILSSGAMTSLETLHISEGTEPKEGVFSDLTAFNEALEDTRITDHEKAQELHQLGQVVLSLPRLVQLSGDCSLFSYALTKDQTRWSVWKEGKTIPPCWVWKKLA